LIADRRIQSRVTSVRSLYLGVGVVAAAAGVSRSRVGDLGGGELDAVGVLLDSADPLRAGDRDHVVALAEDPG
jgi:hypothetical protein